MRGERSGTQASFTVGTTLQVMVYRLRTQSLKRSASFRFGQLITCKICPEPDLSWSGRQ